MGGSHQGPDCGQGLNGHAFETGRILGMLAAASERQTILLERIAAGVEATPERVVARLPVQSVPPSAPSPPSPSPLALRDKLYLAAAAVTVLAAITGRLPPEQAGAVLKALFAP
jgi:hypothetical protein